MAIVRLSVDSGKLHLHHMHTVSINSTSHIVISRIKDL
jgi:hypothetical protein